MRVFYLNVVLCILIAPSVLSFVSDSSDKILTVDVLQDHEVQASFVDSRRNNKEQSNIGIKVAATDDKLKVDSIDHEQLVLMQYLDEERDQFIEILDVGFIRFQGKDYVIPEELLSQASQIEGQEDLSAFMEQMLLNYTIESSEGAIESVVHQLVEKLEAYRSSWKPLKHWAIEASLD